MAETLAGREIVLAGGTGGLGSAAAELLAAEGARLVLSYRANAARTERWAGRATVVQADLRSAEDRRRLLNRAPALYGLAIFAGDPARDGDLARSWAINFEGPVMLAREAAERMRQTQTAGAIVLLGTMQGGAIFPGSTAYAAPKAALAQAAKILAKECRGAANIRVNVVAPGVTAAGMAEASIASGKYDRYRNEGIVARFGRAEDVARAVRFFLEPDNCVTGQVLTVDGGLTL